MNLTSFDLSFGGLLDPLLISQGLAFIQVVFIDLVMAGDNAVAVGIAAAGLPADKRKQAIFYGVTAAVVTRIGFVLLTAELLKIVGLLFAGGLLLLWVTWKMWSEMHHAHASDAPDAAPRKAKTLASAVLQILLADISMSLDNVLAVTGAAQDHIWVLAFGLLFSIATMGIAANFIAGVLHKYLWIGYVGVAVVLFVALKMIWEGAHEIWTVGHCEKGLDKCGPYLWQSFQSWAHGLLRLIPFRT